ncbi:MAG: hypothetical protein K1X94_00890 [Sandaracinaceae bacterium]|nr:hypothetical protein [Sandaracinaceae bacterium]
MADGGAAERFEALLTQERAAALSADIGWLERLQADKALALEDMAKEPPPADRQEALALEARSNLVLLRQLSELHRALLLEHGAGSSTYGPNGARTAPAFTSARRR